MAVEQVAVEVASMAKLGAGIAIGFWVQVLQSVLVQSVPESVWVLQQKVF